VPFWMARTALNGGAELDLKPGLLVRLRKPGKRGREFSTKMAFTRRRDFAKLRLLFSLTWFPKQVFPWVVGRIAVGGSGAGRMPAACRGQTPLAQRSGLRMGPAGQVGRAEQRVLGREQQGPGNRARRWHRPVSIGRTSGADGRSACDTSAGRRACAVRPRLAGVSGAARC